MIEVTDPNLLAQLNSEGGGQPSPMGQEVTDPALLAQLNGTQDQSPQWAQSLASSAPLQAILGAGDAAQNFLANSANLITGGMGAIGSALGLPKPAQIPLSQSGEGLAYDIGNIGGNIATYAAPLGAVSKGLTAAKSIPTLEKTAQYMLGAGVGPSFARNALASGAMGAVMNPEDRLQGAGIEGLVGGATGALGGALGKLMPSNFLRGSLTPEQLTKNLDVTRGTTTPLGDVIESPMLKRTFENSLSKIAGSGADAIMGKTAVDVTSRGDAILSKYLGSTNPMDVDAKLGESLINAYKNQTALKNSLYKGAEEIADTIGMPVEISNFNKSLLQNKGILENVKLDAPTQKLLEKALAPPSLTAQMSGQTNASNLSLKEANILAGALKGLSNQYNSPLPADRFIAGSLSKLGSSLKTDIKQSIDKTGNPLLKEAYTGAEQNYKETFSKFLDKDIYKFLSGKKSAEDLVSTFIKTGRNTDKSGQLGKLMTKLDPEGQNLLKYSYLSRAIKGGEDDRYLDPNALKNLWSQNNLGIKQKAALIPDKAERSALNDYSKLVGMNSEALGRMFNPKTGQRGLENLGNIVDVGLGVGGMSAGGLPGALAALVAKPLTARSLTNKLTSQAYREKLVEKMLKKDKSMSAGSILPAAITTGLTQSIQNALNERR